MLMLSQGVPMMMAGDEVLRTQRGNNNAYCQDNELSWFDWSFAPAARAMLRFTRELIALRQRHPSLRRTRFLNGRCRRRARRDPVVRREPRAARVERPRRAGAVLHADRRRRRTSRRCTS